jgi:hypothetical protein
MFAAAASVFFSLPKLRALNPHPHTSRSTITVTTKQKNTRSHVPSSTQLRTDGDDFGQASYSELAQGIDRIIQVGISFDSCITRHTVVGFDVLECFDVPARG